MGRNLVKPRKKSLDKVLLHQKIHEASAAPSYDFALEENTTNDVVSNLQTEGMQMRKTATKLCGCGKNNIPVVGKITVKCEFCDAKEQSEFYIVKTDSKTASNLQICKSPRKIQILSKVKSQKQYGEIEDKRQYQTNGGDESEIVKKSGKSSWKIREETQKK